jgi:hypothetical protein
MQRRTTRAAALALAGLLAWCAGCSKSRSINQYFPPEQAARKALETALTAWQNGEPMGRFPGTPSVQVQDVHWQRGQRLQSFEILNAEAGSGPRVFSVRLNMKEPAAEEVVRYYVVGKEPLWVYRQEDYDKLSGM